ncbi:MAG: putative collagen-binding domain-containing protein, partial [Bacteroidota bacterium]
ELNAEVLSLFRYNAWWYNPRDGKVYDGNENITTKPFRKVNSRKGLQFNPPGKAENGNDWILVLDEIESDYGIPGEVN